MLNLLLIAGYGAMTALTAWYLPRAVPGLDPTLALAAGLGGFLLCGLAHEMAVRLMREARLRGQMTRLRQSYFQVEEELSWARREMRRLLELLERGEPRDDGARQTPRAVEEVMAEVKLLKSLVAQLSAHQRAADERRVREAAASAATSDGRSSSGSAGEPGGAKPSLTLVAGREDDPAPGQSGDKFDAGAEALDEAAILDLVHEVLRNDRIEVAMQPIVSLPQRKRRFYECFTRLRDARDRVIPTELYLGVAERAGLVTAIDNMLLFRCIQMIRRIRQRPDSIDFFCNLAGHTLRDRHFLADFADYMTSNAELAGNLVFEMPQAHLAELGSETIEQFERLRELGCRFSLDRVEDLALDPAALAERAITYVKLDAGPLVALAEERGSGAVQDLLGGLARHGIDVIVAKIETEEVLLELLDFGIDFGQGYLFGEPRLAQLAA